MKKYLAFTFIAFWAISANSQSCEEIMKYVKAASYGTTYTSYNSEAISKVTFYEIIVGFETKYFAIVCFKKKYTYECKEYIYQVGSITKFNYSLSYISSAGKAFWEYIHPYRKTLGCAPDFDD